MMVVGGRHSRFWRQSDGHVTRRKIRENKKNANKKKMADGSSVTMLDVLSEEKELDDDANAVLGASDDQNCTYPQGYIRRQALYACGTCADGSAQTMSGVCLACSYACHEGHKLFELYTKRNFRCDCGNSKFTKNPCKLFPDKSVTNANNIYNQNFGGVYCTCSKPYPDPDDEIEDEMIQCVICEDWYHGRHVGTPVPLNNEYGEMVCGVCMTKFDFLWAYHASSAETEKVVDAESTSEVSVVENGDVSADVCDNHIANGISEIVKGVDEKAGQSQDENVINAKRVSGRSCLRQEILKRDMKVELGRAVFWADGWRNKLCRCDRCMEMYENQKVLFLLDDEDTVHSYEEQGKAQNRGQSRYDQGMQALSQMDRFRQVEAIHEYNDMKSELKDFLKEFAQNKKIVRKEDIDEFFTQMRARKRQRLDVSVPTFCR